MDNGMDISVILFYNLNRGWVRNARESALNQHFSGKFELIEIHADRSVAGNLNEGVAAAKGKYIKPLCDDDELLPGCLQALFDMAEKGFDVVCANAVILKIADMSAEVSKSYVPDRVSELADYNSIHGGTTLYRRAAYLDVGGEDPKLTEAEEYDLHLRMAAAGYRFGYVDREVYLYRLHQHQKSMQGGYRDGEEYKARWRRICKLKDKYIHNQTVIKK